MNELKPLDKMAYMILDLQYGSTGKGLLAGYLAKTMCPDTIMTAWGPNAGHTYIDAKGRKYVHRMLANGVVSPNLKNILIGPGSILDLDILNKEITECKSELAGKSIIIHPNALVVTQKHVEHECVNARIGSTMKGTGAAAIDRISRNPGDIPVASHKIPLKWLDAIAQMGVDICISSIFYDEAITRAKIIQIEGAQGFSLSMYHGFYPYTTSRDVTPMQVMADVALPYGIIPAVYGTIRTFPIRVADRYDKLGHKVGSSGPCYRDQKEISWSDIGVEPELTTVTGLPRRIFTFSDSQVEEAAFRCNPSYIFLNFVNYLLKGDLGPMIDKINRITGAQVKWIGTGPSHGDIVNMRLFV